MKTITLEEAKSIQFNKACVALGTFDGLHLGHIALIDAAKKHCGDTIAFTFDALPIDLFQSHHRPMQLFTMQEKIEAFCKTGIDYLCAVHFDQSFADIDKGLVSFPRAQSPFFMFAAITPQFIYLRAEYVYLLKFLEAALAKRREANLLGQNDISSNRGTSTTPVEDTVTEKRKEYEGKKSTNRGTSSE